MLHLEWEEFNLGSVWKVAELIRETCAREGGYPWFVLNFTLWFCLFTFAFLLSSAF